MKERPILFSGPMVRAILDGTKTQTRREVRPRGALHAMSWSPLHPEYELRVTVFRGKERVTCPISEALDVCPYGVPGDRLWVRETFALHHAWNEHPPSRGGKAAKSVWFRADADANVVDGRGKWRPSIHMPRWASRLTLEVTSVRVERLHDISEEDAWAEGVERVNGHEERGAWYGCGPSYREGFAQIWWDINGRDSLASNPWVWVVGFRKVEVAR